MDDFSCIITWQVLGVPESGDGTVHRTRFTSTMCRGRWAQSHWSFRYVRVSSMELRASVHNSYRFNLLLIHNQKKSDSVLVWLKHLQELPDCFPCCYWPCDGCRYIINHLHSHFGMQYPPSKCWLFFTIVIKAIAAVGAPGRGGGLSHRNWKLIRQCGKVPSAAPVVYPGNVD